MSKFKTIKLSQIHLETNYRNKDKDLSLTLDIKRNGLKVPLIVEERNKKEFILVDGYRRFLALKSLDAREAWCSVENYSSEEERLIKKIRYEVHKKKKTTYQLERMISRLLQNKSYTVDQIASQCNVTTATIKKYIRGSDVDPDWITRSEKTGAGRHGLTVIHELNVNKKVKDYIADKYIEREINSNTVDHIKKAINDNEFESISDDLIKDSIDEIILSKSQERENIKEVVNDYSLQSGYKEKSHSYMYDVILKLLTKVERILMNKHFTNNLDNKQQKKLNTLINNILLFINLPLTWSDFPREYEKATEPRNEKQRNHLEH